MKRVATPTQIFFNQLLISINLYKYAKNQAFSSFYSRDIVDAKTLQSDWPGAFWPISQELDFSQIWDMCKNTANCVNYNYRPNSIKFFPMNSKNLILAHFPHFGGKNIFFKKSGYHKQNKMGF